MTHYQWITLFGAVGFLIADLFWWAAFIDSIYGPFIRIVRD